MLATSIDKYCYITLRYLPPYFDYKYRLVYSQREAVNTIDEIDHPSVRNCLKFMNIEKGSFNSEVEPSFPSQIFNLEEIIDKARLKTSTDHRAQELHKKFGKDEKTKADDWSEILVAKWAESYPKFRSVSKTVELVDYFDGIDLIFITKSGYPIGVDVTMSDDAEKLRQKINRNLEAGNKELSIMPELGKLPHVVLRLSKTSKKGGIGDDINHLIDINHGDPETALQARYEKLDEIISNPKEFTNTLFFQLRSFLSELQRKHPNETSFYQKYLDDLK